MPLHLDPDKIARMQTFLARQTEASEPEASETAASESVACETSAPESPAEDASPDPVPAAPTTAVTPPATLPAGTRLRLSDKLTHDGLTLSLAEWSARLGVNPGTIYARVRRGFPVEQALHVGRLPRTRRSTRPAAESP